MIDPEELKAVREKYPNKHNLSMKKIKKLEVKDWGKLKAYTWYNPAMNGGEWWCRLSGCQEDGKRPCDFSEFWIGFDKQSGKVNAYFSTYEGMCKYNIVEFYRPYDIENRADLWVQANALSFLNKIIDEGIVAVKGEND